MPYDHRQTCYDRPSRLPPEVIDPAAQSEHSSMPFEENFPAGHVSQAQNTGGAPGENAYLFPAAHGLHSADPAALAQPLLQGAHCVAPARDPLADFCSTSSPVASPVTGCLSAFVSPVFPMQVVASSDVHSFLAEH